MFDAGNDPTILARNAKAAGVDLSKLDFVILLMRVIDAHRAALLDYPGRCNVLEPSPSDQPSWRNCPIVQDRAKLVYGLSQSLDGYVDHMKLGPPAPAAFRHFIGLVRGATGLI